MRLQNRTRPNQESAGCGIGPRRPDVQRPLRKGGRADSSTALSSSESRGENPAAVQQSASSTLVLPVLSIDVPPTLTLNNARETATLFAEQLLEAGVLQSDDWTGALQQSLDQGLDRWIEAIPGGRKRKPDAMRWRFFELEFFACDDVENTIAGYYDDCDGSEWAVRHGDANRPFSGLGFSVSHYTEAVVGATVRRIEKRVAGAGYALLAVVQDALNRTVGCGGPRWAYDQVMEMDHGYADDEEAEESGFPNLTTVEREIPIEARTWSPANMLAIQWAAGMRWQGGVREAMQAAVAVQELVKDNSIFGDDDMFGGYPLLPVRMCWRKADCIETVFDWYHDSLSNGEGGRDICYFKGFQSGRQEISAAAAASAIERCVRVLDLCDVMLWGLCDKALAITTDGNPADDAGPGEPLEQVRIQV